jgi:hypothetical protein
MTKNDLTTPVVTSPEFRALIKTLWEHAPHIRIRVRLLGKLWQRHFSRILHVTASGAIILQDGDEMKHISIDNVVQFEIESQFQGLKPNNHYDVK